MACSVATLRLRFPEFADETEYPDPRIQLFLDDAVLYIGTDELRWCNKYDLAQCYLSAHLLFVGTKTEAGDMSATAGPINSKAAGGVSVSRSVVAKDLSSGDDFYLSTSYGQQFINIRNQCFVGILTANC